MATRGIYKAYFFKDHDPTLDAIDRVYELAGVLNDKGRPNYEEISRRSGGVSVATLQKWRRRETKKPQNATTEAVLRGLGAKRAVIYKGSVIHYGEKPLRVIEGGKKGVA